MFNGQTIVCRTYDNHFGLSGGRRHPVRVGKGPCQGLLAKVRGARPPWPGSSLRLVVPARLAQAPFGVPIIGPERRSPTGAATPVRARAIGRAGLDLPLSGLKARRTRDRAGRSSRVPHPPSLPTLRHRPWYGGDFSWSRTVRLRGTERVVGVRVSPSGRFSSPRHRVVGTEHTYGAKVVSTATNHSWWGVVGRVNLAVVSPAGTSCSRPPCWCGGEAQRSTSAFTGRTTSSRGTIARRMLASRMRHRPVRSAHPTASRCGLGHLRHIHGASFVRRSGAGTAWRRRHPPAPSTRPGPPIRRRAEQRGMPVAGLRRRRRRHQLAGGLGTGDPWVPLRCRARVARRGRSSIRPASQSHAPVVAGALRRTDHLVVGFKAAHPWRRVTTPAPYRPGRHPGSLAHQQVAHSRRRHQHAVTVRRPRRASLSHGGRSADGQCSRSGVALAAEVDS